MSIIEQINEIKKKMSGKLLLNEDLSKYSWFNLGGPAKVIFKPEKQLITVRDEWCGTSHGVKIFARHFMVY